MKEITTKRQVLTRDELLSILRMKLSFSSECEVGIARKDRPDLLDDDEDFGASLMDEDHVFVIESVEMTVTR